jgi:hypothetical protein
MPKAPKKMAKKHVQRKGTPFTLYLAAEQARQLEAVSRQRSVAKAAIIRFAVDRLLVQLGNGQLDLPFGIQ